MIKSGVTESEINCMINKWNPFRDDWSQGFDSDCYAHCYKFNNCMKVFQNIEYHNENHFNDIIIIVDYDNPNTIEIVEE
jgi:hypothetical protein